MTEAFRVGFAFAAGAATFFAPCAFPLLPGYVAYFLGTAEETTAGLPARVARAAVVGVVVSLGFFIVYAALAGIVAAAGARALADIAVLELVVGGLLIVLGSAMVAGWQPAMHVALPERERSASGFLLFGVVYGVAAAGCTAPVFVGLALFALGGGPLQAFVTLGAYAAGMAVLMVAVTLLAAVGREGVLRAVSRNTARLSRGAGGLLALAGVAQVYLFVFDFDPLGGLRALGLV